MAGENSHISKWFKNDNLCVIQYLINTNKPKNLDSYLYLCRSIYNTIDVVLSVESQTLKLYTYYNNIPYAIMMSEII